ncbi:homeobox protein engrailed-1a-like [Nilaparvata lugens]|uniref:homeobox protein engrailed-1a-like n=1 Tax=Nilaparvata lugens TaxID=108931 RepID=UPI00193E7549|nr:homeobox protein engrailed-1a-like [Nilaparvata lugens]
MLRSDTDSPTPVVCTTEDDSDDDVLSVGCESPPPASTSASTSDQDSSGSTSKAGSPNALSFSIDNILRPEFGTHPVDLTKQKSAPVSTPTSKSTPTSQASSPPEMLWPAWVYCTRYSDRPSSGKQSISNIVYLFRNLFLIDMNLHYILHCC